MKKRNIEAADVNPDTTKFLTIPHSKIPHHGNSQVQDPKASPKYITRKEGRCSLLSEIHSLSLSPVNLSSQLLSQQKPKMAKNDLSGAYIRFQMGGKIYGFFILSIIFLLIIFILKIISILYLSLMRYLFCDIF